MVASLAVLGALLGLVVGSFLNVVAYRVPLGRSVVRPPSACPACGDPVRPRDNIPVVSWLMLRGRCRDCGATISVRYPIVEAATAVLFAAIAFLVGARWVLPAHWWFGAVATALVLTDLDHKRIPNRILYPGTVVAVALLAVGAIADGPAGGWSALGRALAAGAAYFVFLFVVALAARGGFGFGDVKLAFLLGLFLGYESWGVLVAGVLFAFLIGGLVAVVLLLAGRRGRKDAIPFGPALVAGAFLALALGQGFVDWYLGA